MQIPNNVSTQQLQTQATVQNMQQQQPRATGDTTARDLDHAAATRRDEAMTQRNNQAEIKKTEQIVAHKQAQEIQPHENAVHAQQARQTVGGIFDTLA